MKSTEKMTENKPISLIVEQIIAFHSGLDTDRMKFSEYVINKVVGDFMNDKTITGSHEQKLNKAKKLYIDIMTEWENKYGTE
ncbi:MAG: hypothetical protein J6Y20_05650 [Lachnospiraceae bacterium]|nr:hypothetical protein [Lachnospiraceae bacterium]